MKVLVFPGQGSQKIGMGYNLYKNYNEAKDVFDEVDDALDFKLSNLIFENRSGLRPNPRSRDWSASKL